MKQNKKNNTTNKGSAKQLKDVIIIGGGWSGIAAAKSLTKKNKNINLCVLEARNYIGGRSKTTYIDISQSSSKDQVEKEADINNNKTTILPVDLGSSWITGMSENNPLYRLIKSEKIPYCESPPFDPANQIVYDRSRSKPLSSKKVGSMYKKLWVNGFQPYLEVHQEDSSSDVSLDTLINRYAREKSLSKEHERFLRFIADTEIVEDYCGSLEDLSMKFFDSDDEYPGGDSFLGVTFETTAKPYQITTQEPRYDGGYSKLIYKLAEPLVQKGKVKLECKVTNVDYSGSSCEVTYVDLTEETENRKPKVMRAKTVLITLPLGVLKKYHKDILTPTLADGSKQARMKLKAINSLGYGTMNKIILHFPYRFWPAKAHWLSILEKDPQLQGRWTEFYCHPSMSDGTKVNVLIGFCVTHHAEEMEQTHPNDEDIVKEVMDKLRSVFETPTPQDKGQVVSVPDPVQTPIVTRWGEDEFSCGSYSFTKLGTNQKSRSDLRQPLNNKLFFAGEATVDDFPGTTHGALLSGQRAAKEISRVLMKKRLLRWVGVN